MSRSKGVAAALAILLGSFGAHKFYLGRYGVGLVYLLFCWTFIPLLVGIIEGISYLAMSPEDFHRKHVMRLPARNGTVAANAPWPEPVSEARMESGIGRGGQVENQARSGVHAPLETLPDEIFRAVGANGTIVLFRNKITILRHRGMLTGILQGMKGDKEIRLSKISSVQLRKPGSMTRGYIQFELHGGLSSQRGLLDATQDENSVLMDPPQYEDFVRFKNRLEQLLDRMEEKILPVTSSASAADELQKWKDLHASGAITDNEFAEKKAEILGK